MQEAPSDGGMTRTVKQAASTIDKFSIRLGVFLRRYPIARLFVILYMVSYTQLQDSLTYVITGTIHLYLAQLVYGTCLWSLIFFGREIIPKFNPIVIPNKMFDL